MEEMRISANADGGIDLVIDDKVALETGNAVESYAFWQKVEMAANRAMFRIKHDNPKLPFDFNIQTMMTTPEQRREALVAHLRGKHAHVDVERLLGIVDEEAGKLQLTGPDDNHPNPFMKIPVTSDLFKAIVTAVVEKYGILQD